MGSPVETPSLTLRVSMMSAGNEAAGAADEAEKRRSEVVESRERMMLLFGTMRVVKHPQWAEVNRIPAKLAL